MILLHYFNSSKHFFNRFKNTSLKLDDIIYLVAVTLILYNI